MAAENGSGLTFASSSRSFREQRMRAPLRRRIALSALLVSSLTVIAPKATELTGVPVFVALIMKNMHSRLTDT